MSHNPLRAVDVKAAAGHLGKLESGAQNGLVRVTDLAVSAEIQPDAAAADQAVLSWRWDLTADYVSRNICAALAHASDVGIAYVFVDWVSVDQSLGWRDLINAVVTFSQLFETFPVIAAYDSPSAPEDLRHFLRTLRRPWIAREILAMRSNPHNIHYVGHLKDQGAAESFGFQHMADRIWETSFANSMLYVLTGFCDMHDVSELALVMPEYAHILAAASSQMTREDALLTAAILTQLSTEDERVNGDINIRDLSFRDYQFVEGSPSPGFWQNWDLLLNGETVAVWSEKDYTQDGMPRRKLVTPGNATQTLARFLRIDAAALGLDTAAGRTGKPAKRQGASQIYDLSDRFQ